MCAYDDGELNDFTSFEMRRAGKEHRCIECGRTIAKDERHERYGALYDGRMSSGRTCAHCVEARRWLMKVCNGWLFEGVETDLGEHVGRGDEWWVGDLHLYRVVRWMGDDWKSRRTGELIPLERVAAEVDAAIAAYVAKEAKAAMLRRMDGLDA